MEQFGNNEFCVGDMVVFTSAEAHDRLPVFYPPVGTVGEVVEVLGADDDAVEQLDILDIRVQWPSGSTSRRDEWLARSKDLQRIQIIQDSSGAELIESFMSEFEEV